MVALVTASCQAGGVEIIVFPPADPGAKKIDEIRVYVGLGDAQKTTMGTANFAPDPARTGGLWARDLAPDVLPYEMKKLTRDTESAAFTFVARTEGEKLSVIALGLSSGEVTSAIGAYELAIPTDYVAVHRIGLNTAARARPGSPEMTQVELWGQPNAETCVQLADRGGYSDPRYPIAFITTPGDADCDGWAAGAPEECDDRAFKATVKPSVTTLSCLEATPTQTGGSPVCQVGGPSCVDGTPASAHTKCSYTPQYCAPRDLCARCNPSAFTDPFSECAIDPLAGTGSQNSRYECDIPVGRDGNGTPRVCPHVLEVPLNALLPPMRCANPAFHGPDKSERWQGRIQVNGGNYVLTGRVVGDSCVVAATPTKLPDPMPNGFAYGGLLAVDVTASEGLAIPVVLKLLSTGDLCDAAPQPVTCHTTSASAALDLRDCLGALF